MKTNTECIPCFVMQLTDAVQMTIEDPAEQERVLRKLLGELAKMQWTRVPVSITQRLQRTLRRESGNPDPYRKLKDRMNRIALDLLPSLIDYLEKSDKPFEDAVRLSVAGNLLDAGSKTRLDPENFSSSLKALMDKPLSGDVQALFRAAEKAEHILYLADNAGEIVFDRLLIEKLPAGRVTVAVRGAPILNDATLEDVMTAGISDMAKVISNGSDAPGTLIDDCSGEFMDLFRKSDLVISKGQGNYETLYDARKHIFFLLSVKCPRVAGSVNVPEGSLVVREHKGPAGS